jgi:hypothetical protein
VGWCQKEREGGGGCIWMGVCSNLMCHHRGKSHWNRPAATRAYTHSQCSCPGCVADGESRRGQACRAPPRRQARYEDRLALCARPLKHEACARPLMHEACRVSNPKALGLPCFNEESSSSESTMLRQIRNAWVLMALGLPYILLTSGASLMALGMPDIGLT